MKICLQVLLVACCHLSVQAATLPVSQLGHSEPINHLVYSPSGQFLSSASEDGSVRIWSMDGKVLAVLEAHEAPVVQTAFLTDRHLLSIGRKGMIYGWDMFTEERTLIADFDGIVPILGKDLMALASDNSHLAVAGYRSFHWTKLDDQWLGNSELRFNEVRVNFDVESIAISPSGRYIAAVNKVGYFYLYDTVNESQVYREMLEPMFTRAAFINEDYIALAERGVSLFSIEQQRIVNTLAQTEQLKTVEAIAIDPTDGTIAAVAETLEFIDAESKQPLLAVDGVAKATVAYAPDGRSLAVVSKESSECYADGTRIHILNSKGKKKAAFAPGLNAAPVSVLSKEGLLAISGCSKEVQVWDINRRVLLRSVTDLPDIVEHLTFDPQNNALLILTADDSLFSWQQDGSATEVNKVWQGSNIARVDFATAPGLVAYSENTTADIYSVYRDSIYGESQRVAVPKTFTAMIDAIEFSPAGDLLTVQTEHDAILIFDSNFDVPASADVVGSGHSLGRIGLGGTRIADYAFNPVSQHVVIAYDSRLELWSSQSFTKINVKPAQYTGIEKLRFSEDGTKFALITFRRVVLYDAATLAVIGEINGPLATDVYFVNGSTSLALVNNDGAIDFYDVVGEPEKVGTIQNINRHYGYSLTGDGRLIGVASKEVPQPVLQKDITDDKLVLRPMGSENRRPSNSVPSRSHD